jgi:predicted nucleic acid-binding protein
VGKSLVVNASPLILLARIRRLDLLTSIADSVVFPQRVLEELEVGSAYDDAAQVVKDSPLRQVPDVEVPDRIQRWDLGPGENQVLAYSLSREEYEAVIDDRAARRCSRSLGIPYTGTLGIVITGRHRGLIPKARPIVEALQGQGIRLSPALIEAALAEVGE